jgi:diguanylate cyclase (GGDEF)-like protein
LQAASSPQILTQVRQVKALSNSQADQKIPVKLQATVTFVQPEDDNLFVQQDGIGIYINFPKDIGLLPGDTVLVTGVTSASFRPEVTATDVRFLSHGSLPTPRQAPFDDLIQAKLDSTYVTVSGRILSSAMSHQTDFPWLRFHLKVPQGLIQGEIARPGNLRPEDLLDAEVQITGVAGGAFDSKMQMAGVWLDVNNPSEIVIKRAPKADPWSLPEVPIDQVVSAYRSGEESDRVHILGTLTYYEPGTLAVVEQKGLSMLVETGTALPLHAGMQVEATGFPEVSDDNVWLNHAQLRPLSQSGDVKPQPVSWQDASAGKYSYTLVEMEGEIVAKVSDARVDKYILKTSDEHLFSATMRHTSSDAGQPATSSIVPTIGSHIRVIGVCFVDAGNHWQDRLWFDLRLRSVNDIVVQQEPSWWTVKRMAYVTTLLSVFILVAVIWAGLLDKRLRAQTAILARKSQEEAIRERHRARQEQRRSHILELISSSEPLPEVLREIASMVSSRLYGVSCWFELSASAGGDAATQRPTDPAIVHQELFAPDGTSMGFILARPVMRASAESDISSALLAGARLAELAIDTRRLYSDLRHRSEHDLLTDIPNRFSMERRLQNLMLEANRSGTSFGLIYVDLDRFKQVNDIHGHRAGDLYLQEVTRRMKLQLRSEDVLARIGGDEFIALVPILHSHEDAEEIALRLERCFDTPFDIEGTILKGSASVGLAVYPDDGLNMEELQRSADAAMYANKETKRRKEIAAHGVRTISREDLPR